MEATVWQDVLHQVTLVPAYDCSILYLRHIVVQRDTHLRHEDIETDHVREAHGKDHGIREVNDVAQAHGCSNYNK